MSNAFTLLLGIGAVGTAVIIVLAIAGAAYQRRAEAADLRRYPAPGRLVDIGGRALHLVCAGESTGPSIVFEAGSGNDVTFWQEMVGLASRITQACSYDRAGLGWSDPAPAPRTLDDRAQDLHALLTRAAIAGPYILAGHSYGGYVVRRFAALYPGSVCGLLLIDAPDEIYSFAPEGQRDAATNRTRERRRGLAAQFGLLRLARGLLPVWYDPMRGVPAVVHGELTALYLRTTKHFATADEMASYRTVPITQRGMHGLGTLGTTPLVVVSRGFAASGADIPVDPAWEAAQQRLVSLSSESTRIVARRSGHMIQFTEPGVILDALRWLHDHRPGTRPL